MTDKMFDVWENNIDEGEYDFLGRLGTKTIRCRLCQEKFEVDMPFKMVARENEGLIVFNDKELIEHYETCHPEFLIDNNLDEYSGVKEDRPSIMILHKLDAHRPETVIGQEYYHMYVLRRRKETLEERYIRERDEINRNNGLLVVGKPIQAVETWKLLASDNRPENVGNYLKKRLEDFRVKGIKEDYLVFRCRVKPNGHIGIEYRVVGAET